jgi:DNA-binding NtrC family response regulator
VTRLLVAEPDAALSRGIEQTCAHLVRVDICRDFHGARQQLRKARPDALVTNLRLDAHNGLHLVLLVKAANRAARCIVHTDRPDAYLIREGQALGAFFERTARLSQAVAGYLRAALPDHDRRDLERYDRRAGARGGRRATDLALPA